MLGLSDNPLLGVFERSKSQTPNLPRTPTRAAAASTDSGRPEAYAREHVLCRKRVTAENPAAAQKSDGVLQTRRACHTILLCRDTDRQEGTHENPAAAQKSDGVLRHAGSARCVVNNAVDHPVRATRR